MPEGRLCHVETLMPSTVSSEAHAHVASSATLLIKLGQHIPHAGYGPQLRSHTWASRPSPRNLAIDRSENCAVQLYFQSFSLMHSVASTAQLTASDRAFLRFHDDQIWLQKFDAYDGFGHALVYVLLSSIQSPSRPIVGSRTLLSLSAARSLALSRWNVCGRQAHLVHQLSSGAAMARQATAEYSSVLPVKAKQSSDHLTLSSYEFS